MPEIRLAESEGAGGPDSFDFEFELAMRSAEIAREMPDGAERARDIDLESAAAIPGMAAVGFGANRRSFGAGSEDWASPAIQSAMSF